MAQWIVFGVLAAFGVAMLVVGAAQFAQQRRLLASAVPVEAEILVSTVRSSRSADTDRRPLRDTSTTSHTAEVRFRYEIDGVVHESDRMRPSVIVRGYASRDGAAAELERFPVGAVVPAWVDPAQPDRGFLLAEPSSGPLVFMLVGAVVPVVAWFASRLV